MSATDVSQPASGGGDLCEISVLLRKLCGSKVLIVGIGNVLKGDDAVGPLFCQRAAGRLCVKVVDAGTVPENYIEYIKKCKCRNVLIVDAIDFEAPPGSVRIFTRDRIGFFAFSTHVLSPRLFADLIAADITGDLYFIGIQPAHTHFGQPVSAEVNHAIETVVAILSQLFPLSQHYKHHSNLQNVDFMVGHSSDNSNSHCPGIGRSGAARE